MHAESPTDVDRYIVESAEAYMQTVILIDDRIYDRGSGGVPSRLTRPQSMTRKPALQSAAASSTVRGKELQLEEPVEEASELSFQDVQSSFAKKRIICSLYQPKISASFGPQSEVYRLCSAADVIIVDWDLHGDSGDKASTLVAGVVAQSRADIPHQTRLVLIYTREANLRGVADRLYDALTEKLSEDEVSVDRPSGGLVLTTDNARVVVLGSRAATALPQFSGYCVSEKDLATRTILEFSRLAPGILQAIVLHGIANLRQNNRRILSRFHSSLDAAFLTHRALLLPEDAFSHIPSLLTDELRAVLEDTLSDSPLGDASGTQKILEAWCDRHWKPNPNATLNVGDGADPAEFAKDAFCNGPALEKDYSAIQHSRVPGLIESHAGVAPAWKERGRRALADYLLGNCSVEHCHEQLGALMSQRTMYDNSRRTLHLGVIVKESDGQKHYLLCLQPLCDSVRLEGKSRPFMFCALTEAKSGEAFTHCITNHDGQSLKLRYQPAISSVVVSAFTRVIATPSGDDRFVFADDEGRDYEWVAELKTDHAQRAAEEFGRQLSRVGLTESEWLRLSAKS